jgi:hypothetical protein
MEKPFVEALAVDVAKNNGSISGKANFGNLNLLVKRPLGSKQIREYDLKKSGRKSKKKSVRRAKLKSKIRKSKSRRFYLFLVRC